MLENKTVQDQTRQVFRYLNRFMLLVWRLGLGSWLNIWPEKGGRIMVLAHHGRRSGLLRHTPVNYTILGKDIYCVAGFGAVSDWYRNVRKNPNVEIWLPDGWWSGMIEEVSRDDENYLFFMRQVLIASGFAAPLVGIDPQVAGDAELVAFTQEYKLLRIRRLEARTGPGGPADLAWIWPLATLLLLPLALRRRRRR